MRIRSARSVPRRPIAVLAGAAIAPLVIALVPMVSPASAAPRDGHGEGDGHGSGGPLTARTILAGGSLSHTFTVGGAATPTSEPLTKPDDITRLGLSSASRTASARRVSPARTATSTAPSSR